MMKDTKDVVACVVDFGMFMPVALKLAKHFKKVYYSTPCEKGFMELADSIYGDGFEDIHRIDDYLSPSIFDEIDLFVFPYILYSGLQEHLESCGKAVWGSRRGDELEMMKGKFYDTLKNIGLAVPDHKRIKGMTNLRLYLQEHDDIWVKMSRYRGTCDTWHHDNYDQSDGYLDQLSCKLGPFKEEVTFYVLKPIKTDIEGGIDTYCIDGKWPKHAVLGYEKKNETYLATVKEMAEMPEEFKIVNEAIAPVLAGYNYRQFFSTEVRVKDGVSYFIDPTCRTASPAGEEMLDLFGNIGDIIWRGAHGELVEPEITAQFAGESLIHYTGDQSGWKSIRVPKEFQDKVKLYGCAELDGVFWWPPDKEEDLIGCIVGIGDTPSDVIDEIKKIKEELSNQPVKIDMTGFVDLIAEIESAEDHGIEFSEEKLPEPADVITNGD